MSYCHIINVSCSMLTRAMPDVECLAKDLQFVYSQYVFNVFARWHQHLWFRKCREFVGIVNVGG